MPAPHSARPACRWSHSTSHVVGDLPSPPWLWKKSSNDDATAFAAAHPNMAPQRLLGPPSHQRHFLSRSSLGQLTRKRSLDHRPPTSTARTTNCALLLGPTSSGYALTFLRFAASRATPSSNAVPSRGSISMQCAHQSCVHCKLSSPSKWQTVHCDFQPPCIRHPWFWQIHVPHEHIRSYASSCLTGYPLQYSPKQTLDDPASPLWHKLHDDGQKRRGDGHIGNCVQRGGETDEDGGGAPPGTNKIESLFTARGNC